MSSAAWKKTPPLDAYQQKAAAALQRLHDALTAKKSLFRKARMPKGIYLWGGVGRGKTMLMDLFFDSLPASFPKRRVHFHEFMISVHDFLHLARQSGEAEKALLKYAEQTAKENRLLCFDEFHVMDIVDAMILGRLFAALLDNGVTVVATSNRAPDDLYTGGLQRDRFLPFIELIKERLEIVPVDGAVDYRMSGNGDDGVYFHPLGAMARDKADRQFSRLSGGEKPQIQTLNVKGRVIEALAANGVARFTFAQLCERPMGAEDYLTIAAAFHTVFLENVPKLNYDRRNEVKRLTTLIDALYDSKTRLIVTADAPPDHLYRGHDHAFEFQRTVSRLTEMQGPEWAAQTAAAPA